MIFVPCLGGLSHNEEESTSFEECSAGAQVLLNAVLEYDRQARVKSSFRREPESSFLASTQSWTQLSSGVTELEGCVNPPHSAACTSATAGAVCATRRPAME